MRGSIRQKGKNSWQIQIYTGKSPDGKPQRYFETVRGTRADAEKRLLKLSTLAVQTKFIAAVVEIPISRVVAIGGIARVKVIKLKHDIVVKAMISFRIDDEEHAYESIDFSGGFFNKDAPELASIIKGETNV